MARAWAQDWTSRPAGTTTAWLNQLRPYTTEEYLGLLEGVDLANVPDARVTGPPVVVSTTQSSATIAIPTTALRLRLLLVHTSLGWQVTDAEAGSS